MLPQSLYQTSFRTSSLASARKPALASAPHTAATRGDFAARRLADDQPFADAVAHPAGRRRRRRQVDDAAEHARERQRGEQLPAGIDAFERRLVGQRGRQEPPRHAVHRRQHDGLGAEQGRDRWRRRGERRRLDRDDDEVALAEGSRRRR
jgi:hypothetical protein